MHISIPHSISHVQHTSQYIGYKGDGGVGKHSSHHHFIQSVSQYTTVYHSIVQYTTVYHSTSQYTTVYHSIPQHITVHHNIPQYTTVHHSIPQYTTVYHSIPQYIRVYHSILQYTTVNYHHACYTHLLSKMSASSICAPSSSTFLSASFLMAMSLASPFTTSSWPSSDPVLSISTVL